MTKPARKPRCAYIESRQRCRRQGTGNPPLCDAHRVAIEAELASAGRVGGGLFVDMLRKIAFGERVTTQDVYAGIGDLVDAMAGSAQRPRQAAHVPPPQQRAVPRQRTQQPDPAIHARTVLGFGPREKLTVEDVKRRHRELARKHHPDRGGSVARMQEVNAAVDVLIKTL